MNPDLTKALQSCIDSCDYLIQLNKEGIDKIQSGMSAMLMKEFVNANEHSNDVLRRIRETLLSLQVEAQLDLQQ